MRKKFINETETGVKYINDEIFWKYFKHQSPSFLVKDLFKAKNNKSVNNINDTLIDLRNAIIIGVIPEIKGAIPNKIVDIQQWEIASSRAILIGNKGSCDFYWF